MNWLKTLKKGVLGILTFVAAYIAANPQSATNLIPAQISQMTVGSAVAAIIVMAANWFKNKDIEVKK